MKNTKTFSECEKSGRRKAHGFLRRYLRLEDMLDPYWNWDMSGTGRTDNTRTYNFEIKDRDIQYALYASKGFILEYTKYDALMKAHRKTGSLPYYLNFFQDGIGMSWNLLKLKEHRWFWKWCTETTADGTYGEKKVLKYVTYVFPDEGKQFIYDEE